MKEIALYRAVNAALVVSLLLIAVGAVAYGAYTGQAGTGLWIGAWTAAAALLEGWSHAKWINQIERKYREGRGVVVAVVGASSKTVSGA